MAKTAKRQRYLNISQTCRLHALSKMNLNIDGRIAHTRICQIRKCPPPPGLEICSPPRTVLSNKSHDKVDFHVLFQYKPRSLSFTTNTFASTQFSLSIVLFFFFNPHPISYTRIDLRKNRVVVRDWFD